MFHIILTSLLCLGGAVPLWGGLVWAESLGALAQEQRLLRTLTVTGRGKEFVPATIAQVRLGVDAQGRVAETVQQDVAQRSDRLVKILQERNVQKLQTTGVNLTPLYNYENNRQEFLGYRATNTVNFQVAASQTGELLDVLVRAGVNRIDGISFTATDAAIATAQQTALQRATQDAQQQARAVLSGLNLSPREVVQIRIDAAEIAPPPQPRLQIMNEMKLSSVPTAIVAGEQEVNATVTLQISY